MILKRLAYKNSESRYHYSPSSKNGIIRNFRFMVNKLN